MKIKILSICLLLLLNSCGFQPIYNSKNFHNFSLEIISIDGDREINNFIKNNLKIFLNDFYKNKFSLKITTNYNKNILTKDTQGKATDYELIIQANFEVISDKSNYDFKILKKFNIKNLNDPFQEKEYERNIKQNLVNLITDELLNKISLIE